MYMCKYVCMCKYVYMYACVYSVVYTQTKHTLLVNQLTSVRDLNPPKAVPFQDLPVTNWNGLVEISCPAGATPMRVMGVYR